MYRIPPPLAGSPDTGPTVTAAPATTPDATTPPTGNVVVTAENRSGATEGVQRIVHGTAVTTLTLPPGTSQVTAVTARLSSPFGSRVTVEAVTSGGRRAEQSVFVGAWGTAQAWLRIG